MTRTCQRCGAPARRRWCSTRCRQTAWRAARLIGEQAGPSLLPRTFRVDDPPYLGKSSYYRREPEYAGEVDQEGLVGEALDDYEAGHLTGWALAASQASATPILGALASRGYRTDARRRDPKWVRVCAWVKPGGTASSSDFFTSHELVLVVGGLPRPVRSSLYAQAARGDCGLGRADLVGRKPLAWCAWVFDLLGASPGAGDRLIDSFPGSGAISAAWRSLGGVVLERSTTLASLGAVGGGS